MASSNYLRTQPEAESVTAEQLQINQVAEKFLALKGWSPEDITFTCLIDPKEFEARIKDSVLSALLLPEGASLLMPYPYGEPPKEDLLIGEAEIKSVDIRAFGYNVKIFNGDGRASIDDPTNIGLKQNKYFMPLRKTTCSHSVPSTYIGMSTRHTLMVLDTSRITKRF
jgi:hypothetical protein